MGGYCQFSIVHLGSASASMIRGCGRDLPIKPNAGRIAPAQHARPETAPIALTVYPGATHAFDVAQFRPAVNLLGHLCEFNEVAARDAEQKLHSFLTSHLGPAPSGKSGTE
jgi:dienelactone hydrolase